MKNNLAIFILSHARADNQDTVELLKQMHCSIPVYVVIDDTDPDIDKYKKSCKNLLVFDKRRICEEIDTMTNRDVWSSAVYARNFISQFAYENRIGYYIMMDDDIKELKIRAIKDKKLKGFSIKNINNIFYSMRDFMSSCDSVELLGFAQSGGYIGGKDGAYKNRVKRHVSQVFMGRATDRTKYRGVMCQDFLASVDCSLHSKVALTTLLVSINSPVRMSNKGGMYDAYAKVDVYARDFHMFMAYPSIGFFKDGLQVYNNYIFPLILNVCHKKGANK